MANVSMPKLSDTMEEGTILAWKAENGSSVQRGQAIAEIESDKASFDIEAEADGVLSIVVGANQPVPVGELIGTIGSPAEAQPAPAPQPSPAPQPAPATPAADTAPEPSRTATGDVLKVSPLARRLAKEGGVDLASISGSGPGGRIVKDDVLSAPPRTSAPTGAGMVGDRLAPSRMQATIATRMTDSKATVPHFYVTVEARVDSAVRLRQELRETLPEASKVTMTDMLTRACGLALVKFPEVNTSWVDGQFERRHEVNIGLAVAPLDGLGLLVPVVHNVDQKDLVTVSIESRQVIERARSGRPMSGDLGGGGFSISNLGMYGVDEFQAIINPPESAILAVGAIKEAAVVENGSVVVGTVMRMTLSADHRVFYGATAAQFMAEVKRLIEHPLGLVLNSTSD